MEVNHPLSDIDVDLISEALLLLPMGRVIELHTRLVHGHGLANQRAMQELADARAAKEAPADPAPAP